MMLACESSSLGHSFFNIETLNDYSVKSLKKVTCESFAKYKEDQSYELYVENLKNMARNQSNQIWKIKNRHNMGNKLAQCSPEKNTKALVISFAGTGAFNPRMHSMMAELIQCKKYQYMPYRFKKKAHQVLNQYLKSSGSKFKDKFDNLSKGPLGYFLKDHELNKQARYFKFASFASEEVEALGDQSKAAEFIAGAILKDMPEDAVGTPGILNAINCIDNFFKESKELEISPKLIVMGHSSGSRSVVKFLKLMKLKEVKADLVMTFDPVKEAHLVAIETAGKKVLQYANPLDDINLTVKSEKYPHKLYKVNSNKWINFYQKQDTKGIGLGFGIHGSPIHNADANIYIKNTGTGGHGAICSKYKTLQKVKTEVLDLLKE